MKIVVVSATRFEIAPFTASLGNPITVNQHLTRYLTKHHQIDILITGVGMVFTTFHLSTLLSKEKYDWAINAGVAGAIDKTLKPGELVQVTHDYFYELGAEDGDDWLTITDLGLLNSTDLPYEATGLNNNSIQVPQLKNLKQVKGQTVNKVHGNINSIATLHKRSSAQVETMEAAAFLYCCMQYQLPAVQLRAISNYVEPRNKANWKMAEAIKQLNEFLIGWLVENKS